MSRLSNFDKIVIASAASAIVMILIIGVARSENLLHEERMKELEIIKACGGK